MMVLWKAALLQMDNKLATNQGEFQESYRKKKFSMTRVMIEEIIYLI